jgi:hypothetical protein
MPASRIAENTVFPIVLGLYLTAFSSQCSLWTNGEINKMRKTLESTRAGAVEALRQTRYFVRQADWLQERFPDARLVVRRRCSLRSKTEPNFGYCL